ncbi:nudix hydrolase 20 [Coprinopsis marcescibilis]|uniref:Nudix hydrolase 20 n=1 Tax=Coprinopsis marcescibilis TaxID=230819 RepID=A0A5C3L6N2_COPMA|nr:nudix hydrolase 20 [Coprinopsis marcescibilis]
MPPPAGTANLSFLQIVDLCDNVELRRDAPDVLYDAKFHEAEQLTPFALTEDVDSPIIGLLRPQIIQELVADNERNRTLQKLEVWKLSLDRSDHRVLSNGRSIGPCVSFHHWVDTHTKRTAALKDICERWRDSGLFNDVCGPKKWRNEMYPIYADPFGVHDHPSTEGRSLNYVFEMERSACALFGVITYGVHMTIYENVVDDQGHKSIRVWVPTRALTKPTWPGYLDNTVAGGIPSGMSPFESLVKECMEEASLPDHVVRDSIMAVGAISYFFRTSKGWLQPEVEYVYNIAIPPGVDPSIFEPKPLDGEVESFELMTQERVIEQLRAGKFKPNCGMVLIDLFIRLGFITPDNEPDFMKIATRLHGQFDYSKWKQ